LALHDPTYTGDYKANWPYTTPRTPATTLTPSVPGDYIEVGDYGDYFDALAHRCLHRRLIDAPSPFTGDYLRDWRLH